MDTDLNSIFDPPAADAPSPAEGGQSHSVHTPQEGKKRGRKPKEAKAAGRQKRVRKVAAAPAAQTPAPAAPKKRGRKPRQPGSPASGGQSGVKLDLTTMMGALVGLKAQDANLVGKITQALGTVNKKSRQRVLEAVGRIFA